MIRDIRLRCLRIPFKTAFRHAAAERTETFSLWVEATSTGDSKGYGESCPRMYVTGEDLQSAHRFFLRHLDGVRAEIVDLSSLRAWMAAHKAEIDANPAAWCAIELALLDMFAKEADRSVEAVLSQPALSGTFRYSADLGDTDADGFRAAVQRYLSHGFADFKVKLSGDLRRDRAKIDALYAAGEGTLRIRVDANNVWKTAHQAITFLRGLQRPLFAVEEPVQANRYTEMARVADELDCPVILDESFLRAAQLELLADRPARWILNLRVSKLGGLLRSLDVVAAARNAGFRLIVGAQVGETSLLTRVALTVAQAANDSLVAQEGAFGTFLLEHDVYTPSVMFGAGGVLDARAYGFSDRPGFGIEPEPDRGSLFAAVPGT